MHIEHATHTISSLRRARSERGAVLVVVLLLVVALTSVGLVAVRKAATEVNYAASTVKRERALMVAQAALDLASVQYKEMVGDDIGDDTVLDDVLVGPASLTDDPCTSACSNCVPGQGTDNSPTMTGQRNSAIQGGTFDCGGRPCLRQGAVANLNDTYGTQVPWCDMSFQLLVPNGDPEARVSVWVRNNASDALGGGGGSWTNDQDQRVVITAQATIRNTTVAIEQEVLLMAGGEGSMWQMASPDEGYGGGHNNDNTAVSVCEEGGTAVNKGP